MANSKKLNELGQGSAVWVPTIGHPASQIKWSQLLNERFRRDGMNCIASALDLPPENLTCFLDIVRSSTSIHGFSATIPHKIGLFEMIDRLTPRASRARSVNVVFKDISTNALVGDMIDGLGFLNSLDHYGVQLTNRNILLFGAGGVGRAIVAALLDKEFASIHVTDVSSHRLAELCKISPSRIFPVPTERAAEYIGRSEMLINATPLGMNKGDALPFDPSQCGDDTCIFDVIHNSKTTPLKVAAAASGIQYIDGKRMLEAQLDTFIELLQID